MAIEGVTEENLVKMAAVEAILETVKRVVRKEGIEEETEKFEWKLERC